jgi:decaprenylphospho-beta-D-erythro-pentofuranosid-2-ulose 2-reductase
MSWPWKTAIIVGASSGIGEELARQLARSGCRVALVARREEQLQCIAESINLEEPPLASIYIHDVREYECVPALFQTIARDLGGLDLVIYAAGVMPVVIEDEYSFAKDRQMIEVNLLGAIAWLNEAAQRFQRAGAGTIVGISSVAGERGRRSMPVYCTSKAALTTYMEALRNRAGRYGVKVVTVKPGPVDTPMTRELTSKPLLISAEKAALSILTAAEHGAENAYVPGVWRWIFLILRNVPSAIFKKMNF